jgi:hypothetical protein
VWHQNLPPPGRVVHGLRFLSDSLLNSFWSTLKGIFYLMSNLAKITL